MKIKQITYLVGMALFTAQGHAASDVKTETNHDVMSVWSTPLAADANVITESQMKQLNKTNVAQALSTLPGVAIQKSGNRNETQVNVRGFDSRQVPIFFDGIPTYVPYDGTLDLGRFMTSELSSVELSTGYTSLLQGPNLMGGAINLTTATPKKPFEADISLNQGFARGADNAHNVSARLGGRNDLGFIQVSGSQYKQRFMGLPSSENNNPLAGSDGRRTNSATDDKRLMLKMGWTPRETDEYVVTYIKQDGDKNSAPDVNNTKQQIWQWPAYDKESIYFNGTTQITNDIALQSRLYHDSFKNTLHQYKSVKDYKNGTYNYSRYDDYSNGADMRVDFTVRELDMLSFAGHWKEDVHRSRSNKVVPFDRYKDQTWSVATEYQWVATDKLDIIGGIGYDWRSSDDGRRYLYNKNNIVTGVETYDDNRQRAFNWEVMARYHLENDDTVQFSVSDRSRFPTQKERYTTNKMKNNDSFIINPHLDAERALTYDLTYKGHISPLWSYTTSAYYNQVTDAIMAHHIGDNPKGGDLLQNRNSGKVNYAGIDVGTTGQFTDWLEAGLNYSYIHADPKHDSVRHVSELPTHKAFAWIKFTPYEPLSITVTEEARSWAFNYIDSEDKVRGFSKTDLRLDYNLGHGLSVNTSANNLFDKSYEYTDGYIEEGRNYWLGLEYKY
ncbi:MAG TPA: TonB-dependent receptor [Providencia sp.]|uniref:TonB-dependent receptor plug domain-containing protein n=1 Tax=Providencia sp. TaxID=589 RepID=UPI000E8A7000|nr:TonB-dependent receptor [Providencia sp.]MBP6081179.1 TonB-dependent receptor [Providencia sp.]HBO21395.1 TonB-dependent receptor [Providencia sp.]